MKPVNREIERVYGQMRELVHNEVGGVAWWTVQDRVLDVLQYPGHHYKGNLIDGIWGTIMRGP